MVGFGRLTRRALLAACVSLPMFPSVTGPSVAPLLPPLSFSTTIPVALYLDPGFADEDRKRIRQIIDSVTTSMEPRFHFATVSTTTLSSRPATRLDDLVRETNTLSAPPNGYALLVTGRHLTETGAEVPGEGYWGAHPHVGGVSQRKMLLRVLTPLTPQYMRWAANSFLHEVGHSFTDHSFSHTLMQSARDDYYMFTPSQLEGLARFEERNGSRSTGADGFLRAKTALDSSAVAAIDSANALFRQARYAAADSLYILAEETARDWRIHKEAHDARAYLRRLRGRTGQPR